jgi:DNA-directed RNA polymerase specialized sigma24 family protein
MAGSGRDQIPEPLDVKPDIRERARRLEAELATSPGAVVLQRLLSSLDEWFRKKVGVIAHQWHLDPDDLYQEAALRVLTSRNINPAHERWRGYVHKCVESAAHDLATSRKRFPEPARDDDAALVGAADHTTLQEELDIVDAQWLRDVCDRARMSGNQRAVFMHIMQNGDVLLADLAAMLFRSPTATRQDKHRALRALRRALRLTAEQFGVYRAWHQGRSRTEIGRQFGLSPATVDDVLAVTRRKIMQFLYPDGVNR